MWDLVISFAIFSFCFCPVSTPIPSAFSASSSFAAAAAHSAAIAGTSGAESAVFRDQVRVGEFDVLIDPLQVQYIRILSDLEEPLRCHLLHGLAHRRIIIENWVEVFDGQWEQIAVGDRSDTGHSLRVRQQTDLWRINSITLIHNFLFPVATKDHWDSLTQFLHRAIYVAHPWCCGYNYLASQARDPGIDSHQLKKDSWHIWRHLRKDTVFSCNLRCRLIFLHGRPRTYREASLRAGPVGLISYNLYFDCEHVRYVTCDLINEWPNEPLRLVKIYYSHGLWFGCMVCSWHCTVVDTASRARPGSFKSHPIQTTRPEVIKYALSTLLTPEIRSVSETGGDSSVFHDNIDHPFLDEVHLVSKRALSDDVVAWLENLVVQLGDDVGDEVGVCEGEEWNGGDQSTTVEVHDFLDWKIGMECRNAYPYYTCILYMLQCSDSTQ